MGRSGQSCVTMVCCRGPCNLPAEAGGRNEATQMAAGTRRIGQRSSEKVCCPDRPSPAQLRRDRVWQPQTLPRCFPSNRNSSKTRCCLHRPHLKLAKLFSGVPSHLRAMRTPGGRGCGTARGCLQQWCRGSGRKTLDEQNFVSAARCSAWCDQVLGLEPSIVLRQGLRKLGSVAHAVSEKAACLCVHADGRTTEHLNEQDLSVAMGGPSAGDRKLPMGGLDELGIAEPKAARCAQSLELAKRPWNTQGSAAAAAILSGRLPELPTTSQGAQERAREEKGPSTSHRGRVLLNSTKRCQKLRR